MVDVEERMFPDGNVPPVEMDKMGSSNEHIINLNYLLLQELKSEILSLRLSAKSHVRNQPF
jgi:hypothetical protein